MPAACPNCGAANQTGSRYCHACGARLGEPSGLSASPPLPCPRCHASNEAATTFCYSCGYPLEERGAAHSGMDRVEGVPAGFWIRLLAWLIDSVLLVFFQLLLLTLVPGTSIESYYSADSLWTWPDTVMSVIGAAYYTVGVSVYSTTVGKRILGLYVLRRDGTKVSGLRALVRHLTSWLSAVLLFVGYLMIGLSRDKRGLHDHICDTVVVKR